MNPNNQTIKTIRARVQKGFDLLDPTHKAKYAAWQASAIKEHGPHAKWRKAVHIMALAQVRDLFKAQSEQAVEDMFEVQTMSFVEKARRRAAIIRGAMDEAKEKAISSGRAVKVTLPKISFE